MDDTELVRETVGQKRGGPHDYTGVIRELSFAQRVALDLLTMVTEPPVDVPAHLRKQNEMRALQGAVTRTRNALGALTRRADELRVEYETSTAGAACDILRSTLPSGAPVYSCMVHRKTWGGVLHADEPCPGWADPESFDDVSKYPEGEL